MNTETNTRDPPIIQFSENKPARQIHDPPWINGVPDLSQPLRIDLSIKLLSRGIKQRIVGILRKRIIIDALLGSHNLEPAQRPPHLIVPKLVVRLAGPGTVQVELLQRQPS